MRARKLAAGKLLLMVALVAMTAAACSSSSKAEPPTTPPTTAGASTTTSAATPTTTPTTKTFTGAGGEFCNRVREDFTEIYSGGVAKKTPAELKSFYEGLVPTFQQAAPLAPSEIKDDFQVYTGLTKKIVAAFAAVNYKFANLDPTVYQRLNTPATFAASRNLAQYFNQVCHIATTPTT